MFTAVSILSPQDPSPTEQKGVGVMNLNMWYGAWMQGFRDAITGHTPGSTRWRLISGLLQTTTSSTVSTRQDTATRKINMPIVSLTAGPLNGTVSTPSVTRGRKVAWFVRCVVTRRDYLVTAVILVMVMNMTAIIYVASEIFMAPLLSCFTFWFSGDDKTDYETWWERIRNLAIVTIIPPPPPTTIAWKGWGKGNRYPAECEVIMASGRHRRKEMLAVF